MVWVLFRTFAAIRRGTLWVARTFLAYPLLLFYVFIVYGMQLIILTPEKELFNGAIKSIKVPGAAGQLEILGGHAPLVSSLRGGEVRIVDDGGAKTTFNITGGFIEVLNNNVSVTASGIQA